MRRAGVVLALLALLTWSASALAAEAEAALKYRPGEGERAAPERREAPRREGERRRPFLGEYGRMTEICGLSQEQQAKIGQLVEAQQKEMQEIRTKYRQQILALLTPEQKTKWVEHFFLGMIMPRFQRVNLTEEQQGKIRAFIAEQGKDIFPGDEKAADFGRKLHEFVMQQVLTEEQRAALWQGERRPEGREGQRRPEGREGERRPEDREREHRPPEHRPLPPPPPPVER